jgi:hypothetical protein
VIGTVIDAITGRGVGNAAVTLTGAGRSLRMATDPLGRYFFVALPAGDYAVTATPVGYLPGAHGRLRPDGPAQPLQLGPGEWRTDADVLVWRPAVISGVVLNEDGEPVVGAAVRALGHTITAAGPDITSTYLDVTDDRGMFRLTGLPPGDYIVMTPSVQVTVSIAALAAVAETGRSNGALVFLLTPGQAANHGAAGDSASPARALAAAMVFEDDETLAIRTSSAAVPGEGSGRAFAYPTQYFPSADVSTLAAPVSVGAGEEFAGVSFYLRPVPTTTLSGVVVGPDGPVAEQLLRLVPDAGQDFGEGFEVALTMSDPDGSFRFPSVPRGVYVIEGRSARSLARLSTGSPIRNDARPPSAYERLRETDPVEFLRMENTRAASELWGRTPVSALGDEVTNVSVFMGPALSLNGQILFAGNTRRPTREVIETTRVSLRPANGGKSGAPDGLIGPTGTFTLHGVVHGEYFVAVTPPSGWFVESIRSGATDLTARALDATAGGIMPIVATLTDTPTRVDGTVRDARGLVANRATVLVFPAGANTLTPQRTREVRVDRTGVFSVAGLPPGDYAIVALEAASVGGWRDPARLAVLRSAATPFTIRTGETRRVDLRQSGAR